MNKFQSNRQLLSSTFLPYPMLFGIALLFLAAFPKQMQAQNCSPSNITLTTQTQVDNFQTLYGPCNNVTGNLTIQGTGITNLAGLSNLTSIGGTLYLVNTNLTNLAGLSNLTSLGALYFSNNNILENVDGLSSLTSILGILYIINNSSLADIDGLSNLSSNGYYFLIKDNSSLANVDGLASMNSISFLEIINNASLTNLDGLINITSVENITISDNTTLSDCCGIYDLLNTPGAITGSITISNNNIGCDNQTQINTFCETDFDGDGVSFADGDCDDTDPNNFPGNTEVCDGQDNNCNNMVDEGLPGETYVGDVDFSTQAEIDAWPACFTGITGRLSINGIGENITDLSPLAVLTSIASLSISNTNVTSLDAFSNITSLSGQLFISDNDMLNNLDGLSNLTSVGSNLAIQHNDLLDNLDGLSNLTSIGGPGGGYLNILNNENLANLDGLSNISSVSHFVQIVGNDIILNLDGLSSLTSVGQNFSVYSNNSLTNCCSVHDLLNTPGAIGGTINISNNDTGCDSETEIDTYCAFAAGDIIITEIMQNPAAVNDSEGEWFEVYNTTSSAIDMNGLIVTDNGSQSFTINAGGPLLIQPFGFLVFAENGDVGTNGGVVADYDYPSTFTLANTADAISIETSIGFVIDQVAYDGGPNFPNPTGASMSLNPTKFDPIENDNGANWCEATSTYGDGDLGTPGAANDACPCTSPAGLRTWTGFFDTDWHNSLNWSPNCVPTFDDDVVIPNATNDPTISSAAEANSVIVNTGAALTITAAGSLTIDGSVIFASSTTTSFGNKGTVDNSGTITIGASGAAGQSGIWNIAIFNNNTGGQINIDRTSLIGLFNQFGSFTNDAGITIGANASVGSYGFGNEATFNNNSSGQINIDRSSLNGLYNLLGSFTNDGSITIGANASVGINGILNETTFHNNACAEISIFAHLVNTSNIVNAGLFSVNTPDAHTNSGTFSNNGIIEYPQGNPIPNVTNNEIIVVPTSSNSCVAISPAFSLGGVVNFDILGVFTDANATISAGTYDVNTNTFTPNAPLAPNTYTYFVKIEDNVGGCTRIVSWELTILLCFPDCTALTSPLDDDVMVPPNADLNWSAADGATGYRLDVGTTSGGTDIVNNEDAGNTTTYSFASALPFNSDIFVTITPYNASGDAVGCAEENFTTAPQCPAGDVNLESQAEVDAFVQTYPFCSVIDGTLHIGSLSSNTNVSDISGLSSITTINNILYVTRVNSLTSLAGLENLTSVANDLILEHNNTLASLSALSNMNIGRNLHVWNCSALTNLDGLENITSTLTNVLISNNATLENLNALSGLTEMTGFMSFDNNPLLSSFNGLHNLSIIGKSLSIRRHHALTDLSGLNSLTSIGANPSTSDWLRIYNNNNLTSLNGMDNIVAIDGDLEIYNNPLLVTCEVATVCNYLASPTGTVTIFGNAAGCATQAEVEAICFPCPTITATATPTNETCQGDNDGSITVTNVSGGDTPYMYSEDNGATYQASNTFSNLGAGTYHVIVKDANDCTSAAYPTTLDPQPAAITYYKDADGDDYSDGTTEESCTGPSTGYYAAGDLIATTGDCDDDDPAINPDATEVCDDVDNDCNGQIDLEDSGLVDNTPPVITCPANMTVSNDAGECGAVVNYATTATDNCGSGGCQINQPLATHQFSGWDGGGTSFTACSDGNIQSVTVYFNDPPQPNDFTLEIYDGDNPAVAPLLHTQLVPNNTLAVGANTIILSATVFISNGEVNFFGLTGDNDGMAFSLDNDPYAGGRLYDYNNGNWTPSANASNDLKFDVQIGDLLVDCSPPSGSNFPVGTTTVNCTATDLAGNMDNCSFQVTVNDTENPSITCPGNQTINANASCEGTVGTWDAVAASDNCGTANVTQSPAAATSLSGQNDSETVTLTADDGNGNTADCSFTVTLVDNANPSITCPGTQIGQADIFGDYSMEDFTGLASALDNCTSNPTKTQSPTVGTILGIGDHTVTITATDDVNLTDDCTFTLTVQAGCSAPTVTCPAAQTVAANGSCAGTLNDYTGLASVIGGCGAVTLTQSPVAGTALSLETISVTITATDESNNTNSCSFDVTLEDQTNPSITCPSNQTINANDFCEGTVGTWNAVAASDNCGTANVTQSPVAATLLSGHNDFETVTLTADDENGNTADCSFTVTLIDNTNPSITCPGNQTVNANASCEGTVGTWNAVASSDNCGTADVSQSPAAATLLNGHNDFETVTLTANDGNGNTADCSFTVTLVDNSHPTITCPGTQIVQTDIFGDYSMEDFTGLASASDNCSASPAKTQSPTVGTNLGVGDHTVTITATDDANLTDDCSFTLTVQPSCSAPTVTCPSDQTVVADGSCAGTLNDYTGSASVADGCGVVSLSQLPIAGTTLSLGTISITITAMDEANNVTTCSFNVTLEDQTNLNITCPSNQTISANAICEGSLGTWNALAASDNCGTANVAQSPAAATLLSGHNDFETVTLTADDGNGNTADCSFTVTLIDDIDPTITCPPNQTVFADGNCEGAVGTWAAASSGDNCGSPTISQSPAAATLLNGHNDFETVTLTANDGNGNTADCSFTVTLIDDIDPTITCPPNQTVFANENCEGAVGTWVAVSSNDNCGSTAVSQSPVAATVLNGHNDFESVTLTADDGNGNTADCSFTVTLLDNISPIPFCNNPTVNLNANGEYALQEADVFHATNSFDNCETVTFVSMDISTVTCTDVWAGPVSVVVTATDGNGNFADCTANVTVEDNTLPVPVCINTTVQLDASGNYMLTQDDVFDGGADNCSTINFLSLSPEAVNCSHIGSTVAVTVTVFDASGNQTNCTAQVIVEDGIIPVPICNHPSVQLDANGQHTLTAADVFGGGTDNCGTVTFVSADPAVVDCGQAEQAVNVTVTATDGNGNTGTCIAMVTVDDAMPPVITCADATVDLGSNGEVSITHSTTFTGSSDNCGFVGLESLAQTLFDCSNVGPNTVTLNGFDNNGNTASCTATVMVEDNASPDAQCIPQALNVSLNSNGEYFIDPNDLNNGSTDACGQLTLAVNPSLLDCQDEGLNAVTLSVTDANGNTATCTATVEVAPFITNLSAVPTDESCGGAGDGKITASASAGGGQLKYSIDGVNFQASGAFSNVSLGNYTVTFKVFGVPAVCEKTLNVTVEAGGASQAWWKDTDGDGYTDGASVYNCVQPDGHINNPLPGIDCNDYDASINPGEAEVCDGVDNDCDGQLLPGEVDGDADGFMVCEDDCDDASPDVHPGAAEICDGLDNDCNGEIDDGVSGTYIGNVYFTSQSQLYSWPSCYTVIQGHVTIQGAGITDLSPLSNITEITGNLMIMTNATLASLDGLENLATVGGAFYMYYNFQLSDCCAIDDLLENGGVSGPIVIFFNANNSSCNSAADIMAACPIAPLVANPNNNMSSAQPCSDCVDRDVLQVFPNPATNILTIKWLGEHQEGVVQLMDLMGRVLIKQELQMENHFNVSHLKSGIYIVLAKAERHEQQVERVIVVSEGSAKR